MSLSPGVTMLLATALWTFLRALLFGSAAIALENLALRHQLVVLQRAVARPRLTRWDRIFWVWLSRLWASWRSSLVIVQPATVLAWHRKGFQLYWRWKSRANPVGRPRLDLEIRRLIRRMARENPTWGRRRIQAELAFSATRRRAHGRQVHAAVVLNLADVARLLKAHIHDIVAVDFFVVPTITFRLLFVFVVLRHDRRELLHVNVTDHPTAVWTPGRSSRHSRTIRFPGSCSVIETRSTARSSRGESRVWEFARSSPPPARPGRIPSQSGSSARFDESASTISSFSMTLICVVSCGRTSPTTTPCGHTNRLTTTVPNHESSNPRHVAGSSPSLRSAGSITATSARPDRERVQPRPPRARKPPDGGPPGSSQAAPSRTCRWVAPLIPSRQGRRRQVQRSTYRRGMRRVPMRFLTGTGRIVSPPRRWTTCARSEPEPPWEVNHLRTAKEPLGRRSDQRASRTSWTNCTTMDPSPTAAATRLADPERTSPAANTPGRLVSSKNGVRRLLQ